jgi:hypothetical protein
MTVASRTTSLNRLRTSPRDPHRVGSRHVLAGGSAPEGAGSAAWPKSTPTRITNRVRANGYRPDVHRRATPNRYNTPELIHPANYRLDHRFLL